MQASLSMKRGGGTEQGLLPDTSGEYAGVHIIWSNLEASWAS